MFHLLVIYISLLTCSPGSELYARYGHTAIRVQDTDNGSDWVYNYGCFSFDTDHFYWKFVKGETYYSLGVEPYSYFQAVYRQEHRTIYEQPLNLPDSVQQQIAHALMVNLQPQNCQYLYNFVFDNCATRPYHLIKNAVKDSLTSTYVGWEGKTYREFIHHYTGKNSWQDFGINLIFGHRADQPMTNEQRLFLPEELMFYLQNTTLANGQPLVKQDSVTAAITPSTMAQRHSTLTHNITPFQIASVPWYKTWLFGLILFAVLIGGTSVVDRRLKHWSWWVDVPFIIIYIILFAIVIFLTYFSIHPLVGWNWRLFLFPTVHLCVRLIYILR
mgnify:CR=1 FL=1